MLFDYQGAKNWQEVSKTAFAKQLAEVYADPDVHRRLHTQLNIHQQQMSEVAGRLISQAESQTAIFQTTITTQSQMDQSQLFSRSPVPDSASVSESESAEHRAEANGMKVQEHWDQITKALATASEIEHSL